MIRVHVDEDDGLAEMWCDTCPDWICGIYPHHGIHALNDIALRHEASVGHLLRVMGSVS